MRVKITPGKAKGTVAAPPSKSMAHRMLMGAGLACGTSVIEHIDLSEDIKATLGILEALGGRYHMEGDTVIMEGIGGNITQPSGNLDCKESGSTLRFFLPIVLTKGGRFSFAGARRLMERPLGIYEEICKNQQILFRKKETELLVEGKLKAAHFQVKGNISSQFITGLLYALPLLEEDSILEVLPPVESKAYIDMTLEALAVFGIAVRQEKNCYYIKGNQTYQAQKVKVEGDYSNAAFLDAFRLLGGEVQVTGLRKDSLQGDQVYRSYYEQLQAGHPVLDIAECPDLGPILMGMAATLHGATFTGTKRLQMKESDRGRVMAQELAKFGVPVTVMDNEIEVLGGNLQKPTEVLDSHNDHRIAMTLTVLCTTTGGIVDGAEAVRKSYPDFYEVIRHLGISLTQED